MFSDLTVCVLVPGVRAVNDSESDSLWSSGLETREQRSLPGKNKAAGREEGRAETGRDHTNVAS